MNVFAQIWLKWCIFCANFSCILFDVLFQWTSRMHMVVGRWDAKSPRASLLSSFPYFFSIQLLLAISVKFPIRRRIIEWVIFSFQGFRLKKGKFLLKTLHLWVFYLLKVKWEFYSFTPWSLQSFRPTIIHQFICFCCINLIWDTFTLVVVAFQS